MKEDGELNIIVAYVDDIRIVGKDDTQLLRGSTGIEKQVYFHVQPTVIKFY